MVKKIPSGYGRHPFAGMRESFQRFTGHLDSLKGWHAVKGPKERIEQALDENIRQPIQVIFTIAIVALVTAVLAFMKAGK
jgi:hypothetical protein